MVLKKFVEVACVVVACRPVKFCRVEEPVTRTCPPIFANKAFGSKKKGADVVAVPPIATTSVVLRE